VPQTIQRTLCKLAIAHVVKLHQQTPEIQDSLRRGKAHAEAVFRRQGRDVLRRQGWTDEQIAAWYKKFQIASKRRMQREFRMPTVRAELVEFVDAVLAAVERKTPEYTARRKASERDYTQRTRRRKRIDVDKRLRRERGREADRPPLGARAKASTDCSISPGSRMLTGITSTPSDGPTGRYDMR
jgi:hypothetical protein